MLFNEVMKIKESLENEETQKAAMDFYELSIEYNFDCDFIYDYQVEDMLRIKLQEDNCLYSIYNFLCDIKNVNDEIFLLHNGDIETIEYTDVKNRLDDFVRDYEGDINLELYDEYSLYREDIDCKKINVDADNIDYINEELQKYTDIEYNLTVEDIKELEDEYIKQNNYDMQI